MQATLTPSWWDFSDEETNPADEIPALENEPRWRRTGSFCAGASSTARGDAP